MNQATSVNWFLKATLVCALVLTFCWVTPRLLGNLPDFPAATADREQAAIVDRYLKRPIADVVLTGSSFTMRLREEFFQNISIRNLALPGGSPLTGAAVILAAASVRPGIVAIETNILSRETDPTMVDRFRRDSERSPRMLQPFRTIAAFYQRKGDDRMHFDRTDKKAILQQRAREEALLRTPPVPRRNETAIAVLLEDWNKPDYDGTIRKDAAELKTLVVSLEAKGVTVFLYELPLDSALEQSHYMKIGRSALAGAFGNDNGRWLSLEYSADEIGWNDGAHLDERSAIIIARSLERSIERKMKNGDGVARAVR
jgi:hypothetical protein